MFNDLYSFAMLREQWQKKGLNGTQTLTSVMLAQCSTSWAISPTGCWSLCWSMMSLFVMDIQDQINGISIELQMEMMLMLMIFTVLLCYSFSSSKSLRPENFRLERDLNPDLCHASADCTPPVELTATSVVFIVRRVLLILIFVFWTSCVYLS